MDEVAETKEEILDRVITIAVATLVFLAVILFYMFGLIVGESNMEKKRIEMEKKCIEANVAKYVVDEKTGRTTFQFIKVEGTK